MFRSVFALAALVLLSHPANAAWSEARTKHFLIYSEHKPDELRRFAERLERYDSAVRAARKLQDPPVSEANRLVVYVLPDQRSISELAGPGVAGFYIPRASGAVAYVHRQKIEYRNALQSETVFFHEYLHHMMLQDLEVPYPAWMVEGYAEFFATAQFKDDGSVGFGAAANHRGYGLKNVQGMSLRKMLSGDYTNVNGQQWISVYEEGWLLTHYLAFEPSRRGQVSKYVEAIQKGQRPIDAAEAAFGDLRKLQSELDAYLTRKTLPFQLIPASQIPVGDVAVRPLSAGESAILPLRLQADRGLKVRRARFLAGQAHGLTKRFPNEPSAWMTLAQLHLLGRQYEEAAVAATRASELDPKSLRAWVLKGEALLGLAKQSGAAADWKAVRVAFATANRMDPDAAQPMVGFYKTFLEARQQPSPSAVEGLYYALSIAPQDDDLRRLVVRQLLVDGKLDAAREAFKPIAYSGHGSTEHAKNKLIIDAIGDGSQAALKLLDADIEKRERERDS